MKVSIVTISFNQAQFLEQAIRSVIDQDYPDIEYIVVDPGSTDGSRRIIDTYESRIRRKIFDADLGPADGLNKGFREASGEIFCYLNSDDFFAPNAFRFAVNFFDANPCIDVVSGSVRIVDAFGRISVRGRTSDCFDLRKYEAGLCLMMQQATFFRKRAFLATRGFNVSNRTCWDAELLVDMALAGGRFQKVDRTLGSFRIHGASLSGSGRQMLRYAEDQARIREKIRETGVKIYGPIVRSYSRLIYKFNPVRQASYFMVK